MSKVNFYSFRQATQWRIQIVTLDFSLIRLIAEFGPLKLCKFRNILFPGFVALDLYSGHFDQAFVYLSVPLATWLRYQFLMRDTNALLGTIMKCIFEFI